MSNGRHLDYPKVSKASVEINSLCSLVDGIAPVVRGSHPPLVFHFVV